MENDMGIGEEIRQIQEYLNQLQPGNTSISFTELMEVLLQGNMKEALNTAGKMLQSALFSQAKEGQILLVQVALLGLTGADTGNCFLRDLSADLYLSGRKLLIQHPDHSPGLRPDIRICPPAYAGLFYQRGFCWGKCQCCCFL